jgi:integral membrane sensor domain MASE1
VNAPVLVAVQSVVGWDRRGVVTSTNLFNRSIGSAVGVAIFGAIANATLHGRVSSVSASASGQGGRALYDAAHHVFIAVGAVGVLMLVAVTLLPRHPHQLFPDPSPVPEVFP